MKAPIIILDHPQLGENIGAAARAMGNFGLSQLRLVNPRDGWPNKQANIMASNAVAIVENAQVFTTFAQAAHDCQIIYTTTARDRYMNKPVVSPRIAANEMVTTHGSLQSALVFGPERTGLENDVIARADCIINIPVNAQYPSLNLGQAVVVCAYEWYAASMNGTWQPTLDPTENVRATKQEMENLFIHLETKLDENGFFKTRDNKPHMIRNIRTMLTRANFSDQEVRTFRGMIRNLTESEQRFE